MRRAMKGLLSYWENRFSYEPALLLSPWIALAFVLGAASFTFYILAGGASPPVNNDPVLGKIEVLILGVAVILVFGADLLPRRRTRLAARMRAIGIPLLCLWLSLSFAHAFLLGRLF